MARLAALAAQQLGVFTREQAVRCGFSRGAIEHHIATREWIRVDRCVYRFRGTPVSWALRLYARILACGPDAAASHLAAAVVWGLPGFRTSRLDVARGRIAHSRRRAGESRRPGEIVVRNGIPVTSIARTLLDLATVINRKRLARAVDNALAMKLCKTDDLVAQLPHTRGRKGGASFRAVVCERLDAYVPTESELEHRIADVLEAAGLHPFRQVSLGDEDGWIGRVDFYFPGARLVIEGDSKRHHMSALDFQNDRERDARLVTDGIRVMRPTWELVTARPAVFVNRVRKALLTR